MKQERYHGQYFQMIRINIEIDFVIIFCPNASALQQKLYSKLEGNIMHRRIDVGC